MKVLVYSRLMIESTSAIRKFSETTAVISITDIGGEEVRFKNKPDLLLKMEFNDVSFDAYELKGMNFKKYYCELYKRGLIKREQATEIASFYFDNLDKIDTLICQCEHGQSRSAAVAAAILEFSEKSGMSIFSSHMYFPNKDVYHEVRKALEREQESRNKS